MTEEIQQICNFCFHPAHCGTTCSHEIEPDELGFDGQRQEGTCGCEECQCDTCNNT